MGLFSGKDKEEAEKAGRGLFVKFDEPQQLVISGQAMSGYAEFDQAQNRMVGCVEGRYRMVVLAWTPGDAGFRFLEGPRSLAGALLAIEAAGSDLDQVLLEVKRTGVGKKTTYVARVLRRLTAAELAQLEFIARPDIAIETKWLVEYQEASAAKSDDQIPF